MKVSVLHISDCPNVAPLIAELRELIADRQDVDLEVILVEDEDEVENLGFHGSPTVLVDGRDPFPFDSRARSLSCRRYPCCGDSSGQVPGFPSRENLAKVLARSK